ncbi:MAG: signal peptide peptidase SppA [Acidimicrobiia bacterium]|nr:signal peptide peptidase SppA [Acidimicrobiia bacterium]
MDTARSEIPSPPFPAGVVPAALMPNVARVALRGRIGSDTGRRAFSGRLEAASHMPNVAAILLQVDSPGGDAVTSDELREAVARAATRLPVVAEIRSVAASGGYLVACEAHEIVARPWALVGSIGAILMRPNVSGLLERVGISVDVSKTGQFKDLGSPFRARTEADTEKEEEILGAIAERFVQSVAAARGMDAAAVRDLATGEVFTAERALEVGLIDHVGTEDTALGRLAQLCGFGVRPFTFRLPGDFVPGPLRPAAAAARLLGRFAPATGRPLMEWTGW